MKGIIGSQEARKASKEFIRRIKKGFYKIKNPPCDGSEYDENKAYNNCIALAESDLLKDVVNRL